MDGLDFNNPEHHALIFPLYYLDTILCSLRYDVLSILPAILLCFAWYRLVFSLDSSTKRVRSPYLLAVKLFTAVCLVIAEATAVTEAVSLNVHNQPIAIASAVSCFNSLSLSVALTVEHIYTLSSTAGIAMSIVATVIADWTRIQLHLTRPTFQQLRSLATISFSLKCVLLLLEEFSKEMVIEEPKKVSKTSRSNASALNSRAAQDGGAGFWSRTMFPGFSSKHKSPKDATYLPSSFTPETLSQMFSRSLRSAHSKQSSSLIFTIIQAIFVPVLISFILHLILTLFTLSQATFLRYYFIFEEQPNETIASKLYLLGMAAFIYIGTTTSRASFQSLSHGVMKQVQEVLGITAHMKLVSLPCSEAQKPITATIISKDIDNVAYTIASGCSVACYCIQVIVCGRWLVQSVGSATIVIEAAIVTYMFVHGHIKDSFNVAEQAMEASASDRIIKVSDMLSQLKSIQIAGLTKPVFRQQQVHRAREITESRKVWHAISKRVQNGTLYYLAPSLLILGVFQATSEAGQLRAQDAFFILLVVYLNFNALRRSMLGYDEIKSMLYSVQRIQAFLYKGEHQPSRIDGLANHDFMEAPPSPKSLSKSLPRQSEDLVVDVQRASLTTYSAKNRSIICDLTLSVTRHELVIVAGPVGCGKTTLLRSFIGDGILRNGHFNKEPGIAGYCGHQPWLQNTSIQQNIIGRMPLDVRWYNTVLNACLLTEDLYKLVQGDRTLIGNNSSNLSYGQEHKVALARALYMRPSYLVLDGIFSAFDYDTANNLFAHLFDRGGILEESPSTVILSTSSKIFLHKADKVVLIDEDRKATVHTDVNSAGFLQRLNSISLPQDYSDIVGPRRRMLHPELAPERDSDEVVLDIGFFSLLYTYLSSFKGCNLAWFFCFMLLATFGITAREYAVYLWLRFAPENEGFFIGYTVFTIFTGFSLAYSYRFWYLKLAPTAAMDLYQLLLESTMKANIAYISKTPRDVFLSLYGSEMKAMTRLMPQFFVRSVDTTLTTTMQIALIAAFTQHASVVLFPLIAGMIIGVVHYSQHALRIQLKARKTRLTQSGALSETIAGLRHIRAFGWQSHALQKNINLLKASQDHAYSLRSMNRQLELIMELTKGVSTVAVLAVAVFSENDMPISAVAATILVLMICCENFILYTQDLTTVRSCLVSFGRIHRAVKDMQPFTRPAATLPRLPDRWPPAGNIAFFTVTGSYEAKSIDRPALKMVSMTIAAGDKVAIVGRTGSGKSSMLLALLNYLNYKGSIRIDRTEISQLPIDFLRQHLTTLSCETIELEGTVRSNLCPWTIDQPDLHQVHLRSIQVVLKSLGLLKIVRRQADLNVELSSLHLTTAERKLMSVARGMIENLHMGGKVIMMDEIASDLDPHLEVVVHNTLMHVFEDRTVIRVMSRRDLIKTMDMTIRMRNGRIANMSLAGEE